ncbi:MAG: cytochrome bc complex cytochrome b subunit [Anaerolineales bacterium]|nr:cytochrome bc complex cytochrome b subunit [Anaerolineales bacterium]
MSVLPVPSILDDIKEKGIRKAIYETLDTTVERMTAGMNIQDIREALRGEAPSRRPNPRLTPHADGFWLHMRPSYFHTAVTGIYPTFRLGWLSTFFFAFEIITGLFLMIFYTPSPDVAYRNMQDILGNVPFGQLMRDLHRLGAEGMVAFVMLHMLRTFITGSYKKPRQFTWFTGVILLLVTLFLSFSGYLLPWDQLAFWAVTIGTSMAEAAPPEVVGTNVNLLLRGSPDIGAGGLLRFYLLHVFALPLITTIFIGVHYYKVILHGHSLPPRLEEVGKDTAKRVPVSSRTYFIPDIMSNELAWIGMVSFLMIVLSVWFFHAPLENHANPQVTPLHTTAPWYFLWLQGLLKLGDKVFMGIVIPTILFGLMFVFPYLDMTPSRRYAHRRFMLSVAALTVFGWVILTYMGTPWYGVETAADIEVAQELIPQEGVGPVRSVPYDEWQANITAFNNDEVIWLQEIDALKATGDETAYDAAIAPYSIAIQEEQVIIRGEEVIAWDDFDKEFTEEYPELGHVIEEYHTLMYKTYADDEGFQNPIGYLSISQKQHNLVRVYLLITFEGPDDTGENIIRQVSGKPLYLNEESEWHEH